MSKSSLARKLSAALVVFVLFGSSTFGALITPNGGVLTPVSAPVVGATIQAGVPVPFSSLNPDGYSGTLTSTVIQESAANNPLGGLTFVYQLHNNSTSVTSLERLVVTDFEGFAT